MPEHAGKSERDGSPLAIKVWGGIRLILSRTDLERGAYFIHLNNL